MPTTPTTSPAPTPQTPTTPTPSPPPSPTLSPSLPTSSPEPTQTPLTPDEKTLLFVYGAMVTVMLGLTIGVAGHLRLKKALKTKKQLKNENNIELQSTTK